MWQIKGRLDDFVYRGLEEGSGSPAPAQKETINQIKRNNLLIYRSLLRLLVLNRMLLRSQKTASA